VRYDVGVVKDILLGERLVEQPCYYGEVATLIVGRQEDGVLVSLRYRRHLGVGCCELVNERLQLRVDVEVEESRR
jgi:hypothetical protein